jgi:hypothetical protein
VGKTEHPHTFPEDKSYHRKKGQEYPSGMSTEKKSRYYIAKKANRKPGRSMAKPNTDNNPSGGSNYISQKAIVDNNHKWR